MTTENKPTKTKPTPPFLFRNEADALFGTAPTDPAPILVLTREMAEVADKMILEVMALFDDHEIELDFSQESLEELDLLADRLWPDPIEDTDVLDAIVANWGAYLGQAIIENVGGTWTFRADLDHVSIFFPRTDLEAYPMHVVRKRFADGPGTSLADFYQTLVDRLLEN